MLRLIKFKVESLEKRIRRKVLEWLLKDGLPEVKIGKNTIRIDGESIVLASLAADPTLEAGKVWFRSDTGRIMWSPDGATIREVSAFKLLDASLFDDFDDNKLTNRDRRYDVALYMPTDWGEVVTSSLYRPDWETVQGTPYVENGVVRLTGYATIQTPSDEAYGEWEIDMRLTQIDVLVYGWFRFIFIDEDNFYELWYSSESTNNVKIYKLVGGTSYTNVVSTVTPDTDRHTLKVTRDESDKFEVFLDGVSLGTYTSTDLPTCSYIQLRAAGGNGVEFDNLKVKVK